MNYLQNSNDSIAKRVYDLAKTKTDSGSIPRFGMAKKIANQIEKKYQIKINEKCTIVKLVFDDQSILVDSTDGFTHDLNQFIKLNPTAIIE